jgi:hypothetical protein
MSLERHAFQTCTCSLIVFNSFFVLYLMCCFGSNPLYMDFSPINILFCSVPFVVQLCYCLDFLFYVPATKSRGHINLPLSVRSSVRPSGYRYTVYPAISPYSFGATALIFCRMFIHIMEVDLFIISYGQAGESFVSYRHTSFF